MPLSDHATPSHSNRDECREGSNPSTRPNKAGRQKAQTVRLTVSLPGDLVDRLRDAVYWSPDLKLAWLIAQSLRTSLEELETSRQGPFPKRMMALRAGRPRLVGQSMKVSPRPNGTTRSLGGINQATLVSQPFIE